MKEIILGLQNGISDFGHNRFFKLASCLCYIVPLKKVVHSPKTHDIVCSCVTCTSRSKQRLHSCYVIKIHVYTCSHLLRDRKSSLVQGVVLLKIGHSDHNLHTPSTFSSNAHLPDTYIIMQVTNTDREPIQLQQ